MGVAHPLQRSWLEQEDQGEKSPHSAGRGPWALVQVRFLCDYVGFAK